jgi:hypothetical protein
VPSNTNNPKEILVAVAHYICPKNFTEEAFAMPGNCSVFSSLHSHNKDFHLSASKKSNAGFSLAAPPVFLVPNILASAVN